LDAVENIVHLKCAYLGVKTKQNIFFHLILINLFQSVSISNYIIHEDVKANDQCRMTTSPELKEFVSVTYQIGFPIGSPYVPAFNELLTKI